jgi:hypothetical protein
MAWVYTAVSTAVSIGTTLFGASQAKDMAQKQRDLTWNMHLADMAQQEKQFNEQLQTSSETERIKILSESLLEYRKALQKESTIRLRDTWIYVAGLGAGTGAIYAVSLIFSKSTSNGNG